jgi:SAM-dependent methyltransferase
VNPAEDGPFGGAVMGPPASDPTASYRDSHLGAAKALDYDAGFWRQGTAKAIAWELERQLLDLTFDRHLPRRPAHAVDFACGTGRVLQYLEQRVDETTGIDVSAEMLKLARQRCRRSALIRCDVTRGESPELDGEIDLVTTFRFLLNAEPALRSAALRWIRAVLIPGGHLVANFHLNPLSVRGRYLRLRRLGQPALPMLSPAEAQSVLAATGFTAVACYGYEYLPYRRDGDHLMAPKLRQRLESALLNRPWLAGVGGAFVMVARVD